MSYKPPLGQQFWTQPNWFIDPQNSTGLASDTNSGADAAHPVLSYIGGVVAKWGTVSPTLRQTTTLTWMSDALAGAGDGVILTPVLVSAYCIIRGVLDATRLVHSGAIAGVVSKNRATGTLLQANVGGALAPQLSLVKNTSAGKVSFALVYIAGAVASLSQPLAPVTFPNLIAGGITDVDTWANGDTFEVYAPCKVNLVRFNPIIAEYDSADGFPDSGVIYQISAVDAGGTPGDDTVFVGNDVGMAESTFTPCFSRIPVTDAQQSYYINCAMISGAFTDPGRGAADCLFEGGFVISSFSSLCVWTFEHDVILDATSGAPFWVGSAYGTTQNSVRFGSVYVAGTIQLGGEFVYVQAAIWGPGALDAVGRCRVSYPPAAGAAVATFLQAGGLSINQLPTAYAIATTDPAIWHPGRLITPVGLDTPVGPGNTFGGLAVNPAGACIVNQSNSA